MSSTDFQVTYNEPCWLQIPAHSTLRALRFYKAALNVTVRGEGKPDYKEPAEGEVVHLEFQGPLSKCFGAGIVKIRGTDESETLQGGRKHGYANIYFWVEDLEETMKKIEDAGGLVQMPRTKIGEHEWHTDFRDTEGNFHGIYTMKAAKE